MSINIQKNAVVLSGKDGLVYGYQAFKSKGSIKGFFKALSCIRKVKVQKEDLANYIEKNSTGRIARKIHEMKARASMVFPLTQDAFDRMSCHKELPSEPAQKISQFLLEFSPAIQKGQYNIQDIISHLKTLGELTKELGSETAKMEDKIYTREKKTVHGVKSDILVELSQLENADTDFSVKQYRQMLVENLQGNMVQFTSKLVEQMNAFPVTTEQSTDRPTASLLEWVKTLDHSSDTQKLTQLINNDKIGNVMALFEPLSSAKRNNDEAIAKQNEGELNSHLDSWIESYAAVSRHAKLADNLCKSNDNDLKALGERNMQALTLELAKINILMTSDISDNPESAVLHKQLEARCRKIGQTDSAMHVQVKKWMSNT
ncbi:hypothetical protein [Endozoicomonas ascidiicola]|uniref:hypothetical protein n=1 Tax=Endozoicomonas ascidiicola TaxID=1698521 RepID=UPI0008371982|nr:hypothetical protein [Endozoicomonas ascidiicola]